jgi:rubrerythrin
MVKREQLEDLVLQSLEHEKGGVLIYETALKCALDDDLKKEWEEYFEQTQHHVEVLERVCESLGIDPAQEIPSQAIIRHMGASLVEAMEMALENGKPEAAQLVACECVVLAETKDHLDWELLGKCGEKLKGEEKKVIQAACAEVEEEEDEHLYHTQGWCRELWIQSLGMKAILPPPEEKKNVKTAIGAARAQQASEKRR